MGRSVSERPRDSYRTRRGGGEGRAQHVKRQRWAVAFAEKAARIGMARMRWSATCVRTTSRSGLKRGPDEVATLARWTDRRSVIASDQAKVSERSSVSCDSWSDSWSCAEGGALVQARDSVFALAGLSLRGEQKAIRSLPMRLREERVGRKHVGASDCIIPRITRVIPRRWNRLWLFTPVRITSGLQDEPTSTHLFWIQRPPPRDPLHTS